MKFNQFWHIYCNNYLKRPVNNMGVPFVNGIEIYSSPLSFIIKLIKRRTDIMIFLTLNLKVSPTDRKNAVSIFETITGSTSVKPGCKRVILCSDVKNDDNLMLLEEWDSMEAAEQHIRSDEFRKVMAITDMAVEPPEISFHTISSTTGFEFVEKIREDMNT